MKRLLTTLPLFFTAGCVGTPEPQNTCELTIENFDGDYTADIMFTHTTDKEHNYWDTQTIKYYIGEHDDDPNMVGWVEQHWTHTNNTDLNKELFEEFNGDLDKHCDAIKETLNEI